MSGESQPRGPAAGEGASGNVPSSRGAVRDRDVVLVAAGVVAAVLALLALSVYVPAIGELLALAPVLIVGLVAVTIVVLVRAFRRGPPPAP